MNSNSTITICPRSRAKIAALSTTGTFTFDIFSSIEEVNIAAWQSVVPEHTVFYSKEYFLPLEEYASDNMVFRYVIIRKNGEPVGVANFNVIEFDGSNVVMDDEDPNATWFQKLKKNILRAIVNQFSLNLLVNGNTFTTGEYGIYLADDAVPEDEKPGILEECIEAVIAKESSRIKISGVLIKDFYGAERESYKILSKCGYLEFPVQPNMILDLDPSWETFDDYLGAMTSKYRTRARKAIKRAADLDIRPMDAEEIKLQMPTIYRLYEQVIDPSSFKLTKLGIDYFIRMKETLGDRFHFYGFYDKEGKLMAFISLYMDGDELIAGFTGLEYDVRDDYDLYLNVLYKLADIGVQLKASKVVYGRTAMEIKSGVGAEPYKMYLYTRHRSAILNWLVQPVVKVLSRTPEWNQRRPFKHQKE